MPLIPALVPLAVEVEAEADSVSILNELSSLHDRSSDNNVDSSASASPNPNDSNTGIGPLNTLKKIRVSNLNRVIIGHLNINSLRNKYEALKSVINGNIDTLVITETKIDQSFPVCQFFIEGYSPPFRFDCDANGGGVIIYINEDIPAKLLKDHAAPKNIEGSFLEINLKKYKWLLFGGYNASKDNILHFVNEIGPVIDHYMPKYDNFLILGDFNSEMSEDAMRDFSETYNLSNMIKERTCFKNPSNPSLIDLILTNRPRSFQDSHVIETGLSDHHKMTITVLRVFFQKQTPITVKYRDYKKFDQSLFRYNLLKKLNNVNEGKVDYETFERVFIELLDLHAPMKEKYMRANNSPFMNKSLHKAVMTRSRLRNKFLKNPSNATTMNYTKYRNYCTGLFKKEKKTFYDNLDTKSITDNRKFWKTVKPLFSDKPITNNKITLLEGEEIISDNFEIAETLNAFFTNVVENLDIQGFNTSDYSADSELDNTYNIIEKFKNHPSILKIKENVQVETKFHFDEVNEPGIKDKINSFDKKKPTTFNNIPMTIAGRKQ